MLVRNLCSEVDFFLYNRESEDTVLLMLKEIYGGYGIYPSFPTLDPLVKPPAVHPPINSFSQQSFPPRNVLPENRWSTSPPINQPHELHTFQPTGNSTEILSGPQPLGHQQYITTSVPMTGMAQPNPVVLGQDPTVRPSHSVPCGPPPLTGFVKQSVIKK